MDNGQNIWTLLLTYSFIQGYLLGAYGFLQLKRYFLAALQWVIASLILAYLYYYFSWMKAVPELIFMEAPLWYAIGPLFLFLIKKHFQITIPWWEYLLHALPFILFSLYLFPFFLKPGPEKIDVFINYVTFDNYDGDPNHYLFSIHRLIYLYWSLFLFKRIHQQQKTTSAQPDIINDQLALRGLQFFIVFSLLALGFYFFLDLAYTRLFAYYPILYLLLSLFIHLTFFYVFLKQEERASLEEVKYATSNLELEEMEAIVQEVSAYLQKQEVYSNPDLRLHQVAKALDIPSHHISQAINQKGKSNFFDLVNSIRIEAIKQNINKDRYKNYTLVAIANEHGFKSPSTFFRIFKKYTQKTPKQYLRELQKNVSK